MSSDEEFVRRLQALTGEDDVWDHEYDKSPEVVVSTEAEQIEGLPARPAASKERDYIPQSSDHDDDDQSDWSTEMILNVRHLRVGQIESDEQKATKRKKFLNKARSAVADSPRLAASKMVEVGNVTWKESGLAQGMPAPESEPFVPWNIVRRYPYSYIGTRNRERVSKLHGPYGLDSSTAC